MKLSSKAERVGSQKKEDKKQNAEEFYTASQWQLMYWKFKKHKLAVLATIIVGLFYLLALFCDFASPFDPLERHRKGQYVAPQRVRFFHEGSYEGPFVYGLIQKTNPETFARYYEVDYEKRYRVRFFVKTWEYKLLGLFQSRVHLFGAEDPDAPLYLLGTDSLGRDMLSRIFFGARLSLSIGLIGVIFSLVIGITLGGVSGYYGGTTDIVIQRIIELLQSFPSIPLWMALSAALPPRWSVVKVYFAITIILSLIGWTGIARVVRGKMLQLRAMDFALAARLSGVRERKIIGRHLLPSFTSHLIVVMTLSVPGMILAETSLSFLGLGLRSPAISWGVLIQAAQNVRTVATHPWLLAPIFFVIVAVLSFNFMGDGLRDAADPYSS